MVFAKTSKAASRLSEQVREKVFEKEYLVIVDGKLEKNKDTFTDFLLKNERNNMSKVVDKGTKNSKEAILDYEVFEAIENSEGYLCLWKWRKKGKNSRCMVQHRGILKTLC